MVRQVFFLTLMTLSTYSSAWPFDGGTAWQFTSREIEIAYRYQELFGNRLPQAARTSGCFHGQKEFTALHHGRDFLAPCHFITQTIRHLKQMLESGAAKYLFPLDADHAHLAVPAERWREKYGTLPVEQILPEALKDATLIALYHTAEHLAIGDDQNDDQSDALNQWRAKRNVVGFFDGRQLEVLPSLPNGEGHDIPKEHANIGTLNFLAHRLGEIVFSANGKAISFDISFADD